MNKDIQTYNQKASEDFGKICSILAGEIDCILPDSENKIWHAHPVWFLNGNPIAGYSVLKDSVQITILERPVIRRTGFAERRQIQGRRNQIHGCRADQPGRFVAMARKSKSEWNYKNIVKRKGVLERLV